MRIGKKARELDARIAKLPEVNRAMMLVALGVIDGCPTVANGKLMARLDRLNRLTGDPRRRFEALLGGHEAEVAMNLPAAAKRG